jgi:hypothetical protein
MPRHTDVVVSHGPPNTVLDIGVESVAVFGTGVSCDTCGNSHPGMLHYGCEALRAMIFDTVRLVLNWNAATFYNYFDFSANKTTSLDLGSYSNWVVTGASIDGPAPNEYEY